MMRVSIDFDGGPSWCLTKKKPLQLQRKRGSENLWTMLSRG